MKDKIQLRVDLVASIKSSAKQNKRDVNYAARQALIALDHDNLDSLNFWVRHFAVCVGRSVDVVKRAIPFDETLFAKEKPLESRMGKLAEPVGR